MGLQLVGSATTELAAHLAQAGHLHDIHCSTAEAVSNVLIQLSHESPATASKRQQWMASQYGVDQISDALIRWAKRPHRVSSQQTEDATLAMEYAKLQDELAIMRTTPTWRLLSAAHRALGSSRKR